MVCPLRIIVITVSVIVAVSLALIALLSGEENVTQDWQHSEAEENEGESSGGNEKSDTATLSGMKPGKDDRAVWWKALDFANGRYLYRQYNKVRRAFTSASPSGSGHGKVL